jgi:hypothetical protein
MLRTISRPRGFSPRRFATLAEDDRRDRGERDGENLSQQLNHAAAGDITGHSYVAITTPTVTL